MQTSRLIAAATLAAGVIAGGASAQAEAAQTYYLVRPDLRMCPSPMCGGAWVQQVNHVTTRCADGTRQGQCYVASIARVPDPHWSVRGASALARGRLVPAGLEGFPELGALAASAVWRPAGAREARGTTFRVADNGVRCFTTPCFSLTAVALEGGARRSLSGLELSGTGATEPDLRRARAALDKGTLLVTGTVRVVPEAGPAGSGRTLVATQLWLSVPAVRR